MGNGASMPWRAREATSGAGTPSSANVGVDMDVGVSDT
jgi:hypothetical protein